MTVTDPLICCVMLTKDRPEMAARAVRSFCAQTYSPKRLVVWNTGQRLPTLPIGGSDVWFPNLGFAKASIGSLRNEANKYAALLGSGWTRQSWTGADIFVHWDDDDWSHPNRIAEQVALLQSSGADAVGYNEMLFWRCRQGLRNGLDALDEAWIYSNAVDKRYCIGTSLCYWRKTWEANPFPDLPSAKGGTGEDTAWCRGLNTVGLSSLTLDRPGICDPMMIATIHGGNTMPYDIESKPFNWKRVPEWDARVREIMERA